MASDPVLVVSSGCAASAITLQDLDAVSQGMSPAALFRLRRGWEREKSFISIFETL